MKIITKLFVVCGIVLTALHTHTAPKQKLLILNTDGQTGYYVNNLTLLAQSIGYNVQYRNLYQFLEDKNISSFDTLVFMPTLDLLKNYENPIAQLCVNALHEFAQLGNKQIIILLPFIVKRQPDQAKQLLEKSGIYQDQDKEVADALNTYVDYIFKTDTRMGYLYGTTLVNADPNAAAALEAEKQKITTNYTNDAQQLMLQTLPANDSGLSDTASTTLPIGLYVKNQSLKNHYLISTATQFIFADIAELFFKMPLDVHLKEELLKADQQVLWEFYNLCQGNDNLEELQVRPALPTQLTAAYAERIQKSAEYEINKVLKNNANPTYVDFYNQGISAAWLEPRDYFGHEGKVIDDALNLGIKLLYNAEFNLWWFDFSVEGYLTDHPRFPGLKEQFFDRVQQIAKAIKQQSVELNKPLPKVFIGSNITTNFYNRPDLVKHPARNIFGAVYSKIPSPLDYENFWKPELVDTFKEFVQVFNGIIPVAGAFFDFEMYHAQEQSSDFTDTMDFSDYAWNIFAKENKKASAIADFNARIAYLQKHKLFSRYFKTLENRVRTIAHTIKKEMRATVPDIVFGAYAGTLPNTWFYRSFLQGLSAPQEPVFYLTFNTDFYAHYPMLVSQRIYLIHGTPLLLSKLDTPQSFQLIPQLLKRHSFIWYNKPSRQVYENKVGQWWSTESSPLELDVLAKGITEQTKKNK